MGIVFAILLFFGCTLLAFIELLLSKNRIMKQHKGFSPTLRPPTFHHFVVLSHHSILCFHRVFIKVIFFSVLREKFILPASSVLQIKKVHALFIRGVLHREFILSQKLFLFVFSFSPEDWFLLFFYILHFYQSFTHRTVNWIVFAYRPICLTIGATHLRWSFLIYLLVTT